MKPLNLQPGQIIRQTVGPQTFRVWKITGIHLGAHANEDLISLLTLDKAPGCAYGKELPELIVPLQIVQSHPDIQIV